jgi:outer membrane protein OmpA-like peptidoglycan-associated protein
MKLARIALVLLVTVSFLTACENTKSVLGDKRTQGALLGGAIGAGTGAIIGSQTGNTGAGIAIGSGIGALTGALIGHVLEKQEQELKRIEAESYRRDQELQDMIVRRNAETQALVVTLAGDFLFDTDSSTLKPGAYAKLNKIAGVLNNDPSTQIVVKGHTDSRGSEAYNMQLSQRRAEAVKNALIQAGVSPTRVSPVGYGESQPLVSENTPAAWQQNRRVEIEVRAGGGGGGGGAGTTQQAPAY